MCIGIPMEVLEAGVEFARCRRRDGREDPIDMRLVGPQPVGQWVLTFMGAARSLLDADEAARVDDALVALEAALRGDSIDHLFADLIDREPQLPPHLRAAGRGD